MTTPIKTMAELRDRIAALLDEDDRAQCNRFLRSADIYSAAEFVVKCEALAALVKAAAQS